MDRVFNERLEAFKAEIVAKEKEALDRERLIRLEIRAAQEEKKKAIEIE